ncbi:MAG: trehalose-phosphatase [Burkholderiales bacterium]
MKPQQQSLPEQFGADCSLFLDFDGTLVDLAARPEGVSASPSLLETLSALRDALGGALAVVSGRPIEQIDHFLAPLELAAAGVHGAERRGADGRMVLADVASLEAVESAAEALVHRHPALLIERKRGSLALHYRAAPELQAECTAAMKAAVAASDGLVLLPGKMVLEAKSAGIGKGGAIAALLREAPFEGRTPVFIGDDVTDEAGFEAVQAAGGVGIKVGPEDSVAQYRLDSPQAVRTALAMAAKALADRAAT